METNLTSHQVAALLPKAHRAFLWLCSTSSSVLLKKEMGTPVHQEIWEKSTFRVLTNGILIITQPNDIQMAWSDDDDVWLDWEG